MFRNYLTTAFRGFYRQKLYTMINIAGLSVGLASSFLIVLWVSDELAIDQFHHEGDRIYQVVRNYQASDTIHTWTSVPKPVAEVFDEQFPEITRTVIVTWNQEAIFADKAGASFRRDGLYVSDDFLKLFTYPLIVGDTDTALDNPDAIAISTRVAEQYFGPNWRDIGVLGQTISIDHRKDFRVTGVFDYPAGASSLRFDYLIPFEDYLSRNTWLNHWGNSSTRLYVQLAEDADPQDVTAAIRTVINDNHDVTNSFLWLQPYQETHLYSKYDNGVVVGGRIEYVRIFAIVAVFLLVIAGINYTNLATARSALRAKEIGVRKAVGANKGALIRQFMGESILLTAVAAVLASSLIQLTIPAFNELTDKELTFSFANPLMLTAFIPISLLTGLLGGAYPALYLSGFNPVRVLRSRATGRSGSGRLRQSLVIFQFAWSILLIIGTLTVYNQLTYIWSKNLGMERENLVHIGLEGDIKERFEAFKNELLASPEFLTVTRSDQNPLSVGSSTSDPKWDGKPEDAIHEIKVINADFDYVETMKLNLVSGRTFALGRDQTEGKKLSYLINERMAAVMGTDDPVGQQIRFWGDKGTVIGVLSDFHTSSMHNPISPVIVRLDPEDGSRYLYARIAAGKEKEALRLLEDRYHAFNPNYPFTHRFVDEDFERMYKNEAVLARLATVFAVLAGFISCLGLFGLASFTAVQRTKEIGIRKTLGATVPHLVSLMSRDFIKLVIISFAIAVPLASRFLGDWLNGFEYRIDLSWTRFAGAGLLALVIAWVTVSSQAIRVARANPTDSLKSD